MALTTAVLLVVDRELLGGGEGGVRTWGQKEEGGGREEGGRLGVGEVQGRVLPVAILVFPCPCPFSCLVSFLLPFLSYTLRLVLGIPCISVQFA